MTGRDGPGAKGGSPVAYVNARLLDPASGLDVTGGVIVADGVVADLGPHLARASALAAVGPRGIEAVDCGGAVLAPALIDMRVQLREPGEEHKETIASAGEAAAAGGVGTMVCLPNTRPPIDDPSLVESVFRRARDTCRVRVFPYAAVTRGLQGREMTELGLLAEAGAVGFSDGTAAIADPQLMRRALAYARIVGRPIIQHPEEPALASGAMNAGEIATRLGLSGIPVAAEVIMVERDLRLVELTGGRLHVAHVSTGAAVDALRRAKARGLPVSADTAPQYFALNETAVGEYRTFAKLSPPLRGEDDRKAVIDGLKDGTIDAIASDHAPHDQDSKRLPFAQAAAGMIGLETLLAVSLDLVHNGHLPLPQVLAKLTVNPAAILGLEGGRLAKGEPADLVVFDLERPWRIEERNFRSKSKNSPFDGRPVQGRVLRTLVAGATVFAGNDV
ncbi:MAG TPA: dihydroorotase [Alphaproteobacteria bacterium]|nr:dihydroorotase [Alphaproteobacteria bacterium]